MSPIPSDEKGRVQMRPFRLVLSQRLNNSNSAGRFGITRVATESEPIEQVRSAIALNNEDLPFLFE